MVPTKYPVRLPIIGHFNISRADNFPFPLTGNYYYEFAVMNQNSFMNGLMRYCFIFIGVGLFSCSKTNQSSYPSYYGQWQFIGTSSGPWQVTPSPDSIVILTLKPGNTYEATLNDSVAMQGSFTIDANANGVILKFLNITQPFGTNTSEVSGGIHFLFFNTTKIGQLTLFQTNITSSPGDTLNLTSYPITPEFTSDYFKRIR